MENIEMKEEKKVMKLTYDPANGKTKGLHIDESTMEEGEVYIPFPESMGIDDLNCVEDGMEWAVVNGTLQKRKIQYTLEQVQNKLRFSRNSECFDYINRGQLWYNTLTDEQKSELNTWYHAWLDVTVTLMPPTKPIWLK